MNAMVDDPLKWRRRHEAFMVAEIWSAPLKVALHEVGYRA
jgi:hypothetical protein